LLIDKSIWPAGQAVGKMFKRPKFKGSKVQLPAVVQKVQCFSWQLVSSFLTRAVGKMFKRPKFKGSKVQLPAAVQEVQSPSAVQKVQLPSAVQEVLSHSWFKGSQRS